MDIAQLSTQLKTKTPAMVYLILGKQQVLQQQAIDAFISLIPENEQVMNVGRYDMEATPLAVALDKNQLNSLTRIPSTFFVGIN